MQGVFHVDAAVAERRVPLADGARVERVGPVDDAAHLVTRAREDVLDLGTAHRLLAAQ